ncbi:hypothetical protein OCU04_008452 [Sclerotinia nivalis]|uniref:Uncharacterized protein n=1 Tax=Sclerotinia nivalis TaxID=352851 RepID=A0A9X0AI34_9HELO|nr:hypothetical protein OCU04_008452 [Sclerotinia nivalis]
MLLKGFTAAELESVLALADSYETTSRRINYGNNLDNVPIHPMWDRENWQYDLPRHIARYPFGDGNEYWEASDSPCTNADVILTSQIRPRMTLSSVWRAMEPALKLASSVIANIHTWEWFNSLLKGPWERVPRKDLPPNYTLNVMRFFSKEDRKDGELKSDAREFFQRLSKYTYFALSGGKCTSKGMPQVSIFLCGHTAWYPRRAMPSGPVVPNATLVTIAYDLVEPLLNPTALPEDRALDTFRLAEDILHETAHAMCHHMTRRSIDAHDWAWVEPYFENEPIPELGFSATNQVFGGIATPVVTLDISGASSGGLIFHNWPTYRHEHYTKAPVLPPSKQKDWENIIYYPNPVSYFMSLQSREFWDVYVRKYGSEAAHAGPKIIGICKPKPNPGGPKTHTRLRHTIPASDRKDPGHFSRTKTKIAHSFDVEKRRIVAIISEAAKGVKPEVMEPVLASGEYGWSKIHKS